MLDYFKVTKVPPFSILWTHCTSFPSITPAVTLWRFTRAYVLSSFVLGSLPIMSLSLSNTNIHNSILKSEHRKETKSVRHIEWDKIFLLLQPLGIGFKFRENTWETHSSSVNRVREKWAKKRAEEWLSSLYKTESHTAWP